MNTYLPLLLFIAGLLHLAITSAGFMSVLVLDWRRTLLPLCAMTRHIIWAHAAFVLMTIIAFGVVSLSMSASLASGAPLARAICGFIAIFWATRLFVQFFLFDARPHLKNFGLKLGFHGLTVVFSYFVFTYAAAAIS
jgi:hypothetical protein